MRTIARVLMSLKKHTSIIYESKEEY